VNFNICFNVGCSGMCKMLTFFPGIFFVLAHVSVISRFGNAVVSRNVQRLVCIFCSMVFAFCVCVVVFQLNAPKGR